MDLDLPYLFAPKGKRKRYFYYRRGGRLYPLKDTDGHPLKPGDAGFMGAWEAIHGTFGTPGDPPPPGTRAGTLAHVAETYLESPEYLQLAERTRTDYRYYVDALKADHGDLTIATMPREFVLGLRDKYAATPRAANYRVAVLKVLLAFAEDRPVTFRLPPEWTSPGRHAKRLRTGPGHRPWEEHEIAAFRDRWKVGDRERVAFELFLNTGHRLGDVAAVPRTAYRRGWVTVTQSKTGERVTVPASRDLRAVLDPWLKTHKHMVIITGKRGRALTADALGHMMTAAYRAAELAGVTTHGLRYTAGTVLAEIGCDEPTIGAILGHRTAEMVRKYTAKKRRARAAITRLDKVRRGRNRNGT